MLYLSTTLLAAIITVSLIPLVIRLAVRFQMVDVPGPRKVHACPVPRVGGVAMALGAFVPLILWTAGSGFVRAYLAGAAVLVAFGLVDDLRGLGYRTKFLGQILAAIAVVVYGGIRVDSLGTLLPDALPVPGWFAVPLSVIVIVGVTNAFNLTDGLDGLAGGISLLVFCCIGYLAYLSGNNDVLLFSLALAGAIFGFLRYNTHPAILFMGDTGSQLLGFSAAVFAIKITQGATPLSPLLPLIILGLPVLDTITVMVSRIRDGRSPFSPDKNHFHHRLMGFGLSHSEAVLAIYLTQAVMVVSAIFFRYYTDWALLIFYVAFSAALLGALTAADRTGFRFKRYPLIDDAVKGMRTIRDGQWIVRISFTISRVAIPVVFLLACLLPGSVPKYVSIIAACFGLAILLVRRFARDHMGLCLRYVLYMSVPLVLYLAEADKAAWVSSKMFTLYHLSFGLIAFFVLLTVKYTRRTKGFQVTTMDFLVIFIAAIIPNLPDSLIQSLQIGLLAVEIIVLLFGFEVLLKEFRGRFEQLAAVTLAALVLIGIRGGSGF